MDRRPEDLSKTIATIQRDLEELKNAQTKPIEVTTGMIEDGAVTAPKIDPAVIDAIGSYSTTETETPFTWIDGKTIYKTTITVTAPASAMQEVQHGISNFGDLVRVEGVCTDAANGWQPITRVLPSQITAWGVGIGDVKPTKFTLFMGSSYGLAGVTAHITLYYTKAS